MVNFFVDLLIKLNNITGNLGVTLIVVGIVSRAIFYPFLKSAYKQSQLQRELKSKMDELKKKHKDKSRLAKEQMRLYREMGINPVAGCLSLPIQLVVLYLIFAGLRRILGSGVETHFLIWDLAKPDTYKFASIPFAIPGILIVLTAVATFFQTKMATPTAPTPPPKNQKDGSGNVDFTEALAASQGQMVFLLPIVILFSGISFPAGLALYWFAGSFFGIIQQYYIAGWGGLTPWVKMLKKA